MTGEVSSQLSQISSKIGVIEQARGVGCDSFYFVLIDSPVMYAMSFGSRIFKNKELFEVCWKASQIVGFS